MVSCQRPLRQTCLSQVVEIGLLEGLDELRLLSAWKARLACDRPTRKDLFQFHNLGVRVVHLPEACVDCGEYGGTGGPRKCPKLGERLLRTAADIVCPTKIVVIPVRTFRL